MNKINLNIKKVFKPIEVNGKRIHIPKLGLKHHAIVNSSGSLSDGLKKVLQSIDPNLSRAERDLVTLHLLAYNGKIKNSVVLDGHERHIDDVVITQNLRFDIDGTEYRFRTPDPDDMPPTVDQVLNKYCVGVKRDGIEQPIPDFLKMPAYTHNWVYQICDSISLKTEFGDIKGLYKLMEFFNG